LTNNELFIIQICWWDSRKGGNPEGIVPMDQCHIDPVYKTIWINAKAGTEFFTASTDGMVSSIIMITIRTIRSRRILINCELQILKHHNRSKNELLKTFIYVIYHHFMFVM